MAKNKKKREEFFSGATQGARGALSGLPAKWEKPEGTGSQTTNTGRTGTAQNGVQVLQAAQAALNKNNSPYAPVTVPKIPQAGQTPTLPDALKPGTGKVMTPQARLALAGDVEKRRKENGEPKGGGRIGNLLGAAGNSWLAGQANMLGTLLGSGIDSTSGAGLSAKVREKEIKEYRENLLGGARDKSFATADRHAEKAKEQEQAAKEGLGNVGKLLVDAGIAGTQMAMDATVGGLTGTGMLSMGTRTFGDSARQAREAGASWDEANRYGLGKAGVEVGTEKLFDAMKLFGGGKMDKAMEAALNKMAKTNAGRTALRILGNIGGESAEETISDLVDPILRQTYDKNAVRDTYGTAEGRKELASETLYDALVGGILGGIGGAGSIVTGENARKNDALRTPEEREAAERPQRIAAADAARARQDAMFGTDAETLADMQARQNRTESPVTGAEPQGGNLSADTQTALTQSETGQNVYDWTNRANGGSELGTASVYLMSRSIGGATDPTQMERFMLREGIPAESLQEAVDNGYIEFNGKQYVLTKRGDKLITQMIREDVFSTEVDAPRKPAPAQPKTATQADESAATVRTFAPEDHIDNRTDDYIAKRSTKPFQHEHPELHDNFVAVAREMQALLNASVESDHPGKKGGTVAWYPEAIRKLTESTGVSRPKLMGVLQDIIDNHGSEDYATAKRVEKVLDELLTKGYEGYGRRRVPPDDNYLAKKDKINGAFDRNSFDAYLKENELSLALGEVTEQELKDEWEALQAQRAAEATEAGANVPQTPAEAEAVKQTETPERVQAETDDAAALKASLEEMLGRPLTNADLDSMTDHELADRIRPAVEQDTVMGTGAAARGFTRSDAYDAAERYMQAIDEYGAMPERENLAKQIPVPRSMDGESVVSRVAQSAINAENTDNRTAKEINREVADGGFSYAVITDADASQRAQETIKDKGWDGALSDWTAEVKSGKVSKDTVTTGLTLYNAAVAAGEPRAAARILVDLTNNIRSGAQATQAASLLDKLTPQGQLYGIQRSVENLNESIRNRLGDKATDVVINEDLAAAYLEAQTDEERADAMDAIYQNVADQIPATWQDKLNAWRYLSMLFNPLTHIRNIVGNSGFAPVRGVKNVIGAGLEAAFIGKNEGRTKSLVMPAFLKTAQDKARYQAANDEWGDVVDLIQSGGKFKSDYNEIRDRQTIFGLKVLEAARKFNNTALDTEDTWFSKQAYSASLTQYLKANGITAEQYNAPGFDKSAARAYAIKEAQKATYRDFNAFSDYIAGLGKTGNKVGDTLVEAVLPFKRTPANILARGVEYSPIGLLRGVKNAMFDVKSGKVSAAEAIDHIASGLTGTGLTALGVLLAHLGLLTGGDDKDEREAKENSLTGHKPYALEVGGHSIPLDWLAPEALPVFVGVELYNGLIRDGGYNGGDSWLDPIKRISEPMLEMSMLSGINDILDSISYSDNKTWAVLSSAATSYLSQYVPTLFGKIEQTTEGNRKSTYINKDSAIPSDVQRALGKAFNKLPGEFQQVDYIDAWGRKQTNGTVGERILRNFINPSNYTSINETPVDTALRELVRKTGDSSLYPSAAERKITVNGEDRNLTAAQYTRYATEYGQMRYQLLDEARKSAAFRRMTSAEQAETVHKLYEYANAVSQHNIFRDKDYDAWVGYAQNAKREFGISSADYIMLQQRYGTNYLSGKDAHEKAVQAYKNGVELETYLQIRNSYSDYDADGNGSMKQSELKSALDAADLTDEQRAVLYGLYNKTWKNNPYL